MSYTFRESSAMNLRYFKSKTRAAAASNVAVAFFEAKFNDCDMTPRSCCGLKLLIAVTASLCAGGVSGYKPDSATRSESTQTGTEPIQNTGRLTNTVAESDWRSIKEKNEQLAAENRLLRRMLVEGTSQQGNAPTNKAALRPTVSRISTNSADYWITLDKKRHNKKCRYYQIFKGRPCGPDEGEPCPICGG